jgi:hypothetical protein
MIYNPLSEIDLQLNALFDSTPPFTYTVRCVCVCLCLCLCVRIQLRMAFCVVLYETAALGSYIAAWRKVYFHCTSRLLYWI